MNKVNIDEAIEETLKRLNKRSGGEAECYVVPREDGAALYVKDWCGNPREGDQGMVGVFYEDADEAAEVLGLDTDLCWVWCDGGDGPTLASFETPEDRELWKKQV